jgi:hypothetical protein
MRRWITSVNRSAGVSQLLHTLGSLYVQINDLLRLLYQSPLTFPFVGTAVMAARTPSKLRLT